MDSVHYRRLQWEPIPATLVYGPAIAGSWKMTATRGSSQPNQTAVRPTHWLSVLEQELKSRVGWVDEAVSPFAGGKAPAPTPRKIPAAQTEKAA